MNESWRELLYPLGYLASIAFGGRFLLQWITSEVQQKSVVTRAFWRLSLVGNFLLMIHSLLQLQFHVCVIQACNGVISWRNLNLMEDPLSQVRFKTVIKMFAGAILATLLAFLIQGYSGTVEWFRLPTPNGDNPTSLQVSTAWHMIGFAGLILFSSRFWVQWWEAEQSHVSKLGAAFWWLSLSGGVLTLIYFVRIDDPVNILGPAFGLVPYIRNLILISKSQRVPTISGVA